MPLPPRLAGFVLPFAACAALAGCGDSTKAATPTAPSATVTALSLNAPPAAIKAGDTFQLTATARLSNGQTTTSGFSVTWTSSDANVATVTPGGLVTAKSDGRATISASANAITASADFLIRGGRTLTGMVTESAPTTSVTIAGARVAVIDGVYAGAFATTDAGGAFSLNDVNGIVNLRISAPGFDDAQMTADTAGPSGLTVRLVPSARTVSDEKLFQVEKGSPLTRSQSTMTFDMHRAGRVDVSTGGSVFAGESAPLCSELRDDDNKLLWDTKVFWQLPAGTTLSLEGGRRYTLKVNDCGWAGRPILIYSRLAATHPY